MAKAKTAGGHPQHPSRCQPAGQGSAQDKAVTEDEARGAEDDIQKLTDKAIKDVDEVVKAKEQELMTV